MLRAVTPKNPRSIHRDGRPGRPSHDRRRHCIADTPGARGVLDGDHGLHVLAAAVEPAAIEHRRSCHRRRPRILDPAAGPAPVDAVPLSPGFHPVDQVRRPQRDAAVLESTRQDRDQPLVLIDADGALCTGGIDDHGDGRIGSRGGSGVDQPVETVDQGVTEIHPQHCSHLIAVDGHQDQ